MHCVDHNAVKAKIQIKQNCVSNEMKSCALTVKIYVQIQSFVQDNEFVTMYLKTKKPFQSSIYSV